MSIGLKLYTTNFELIHPFADVLDKGYYHFVELYIIPGTSSTLHYWKAFNVPYIIHAPHSIHGFNLAQAGKRNSNKDLFLEARRFADELNAPFIIVHGGNNGSFDETASQLVDLDDTRILLENKPMIGIHGESCVGCIPEDFRMLFDKGIILGMALDFGHAVCTANTLRLKPLDLIDGLNAFRPTIYHLSDGNYSSQKDTHLNLGQGDFEIDDFLARVPTEGLLTLETPRETSKEAEQFKADVMMLNKSINRLRSNKHGQRQ